MAVRTALIAGGGIAGAATALALHRAGIPAEIYEAHPSGGEDAGAFLTVMRNGMTALAAIDAAEAVTAVSYPARAVSLWDAGFTHLGRRPIESPARTITRAALYRALQELATARGIPVHHGRRLADATVTPTGVLATFTDGTTASGDILIGADGIHSRTRHLIDPAAPAPRFAGQHVVYGYTPGNPSGAAVDEYHMVRGTHAFFGFTVPADDGRTWWFARLPAPAPTTLPTGPQPGSEATARSWRDLVLTACRDHDTPLTSIVSGTGTDIIGGDSYDIPTTPHWHDTHLALVGDAAHAATPAAAQGASMALEDAITLATALTSHDTPADAFATYESLRRTQTEETVATSAKLSTRGTRSARAPGSPTL
ncbi:FAD-dependent monooxygenase [Actinoplanes sp. NPDC051851]|uniref:FAD-dependent monooxygenase n=1 Tax=Actinoplanes sp. NPDC051851 TaxID=3154753 RepID=UPI0034468E3C